MPNHSHEAGGARRRAHVNRRRCLYTGRDIVEGASSDDAHPSREHPIPLSLGGLDAFSVEDVSRAANNEAGNKIDDRLAANPLLLMLRQRYRLEGHRGGVPDLHFQGAFTDINRDAWLDVTADGQLAWGFPGSSQSRGQAKMLTGSEQQIRGRLASMLRSASTKGLRLQTLWGDIRDADDIEAAILLADKEEGREFKASLRLNLRDFLTALERFCVKVALCAGYKVLGPEWAFGPAGIKLRSTLFASDAALARSGVRGSVQAELPVEFRDALGCGPDRHVVAVVPLRSTTVAIVSLFGGALGHALIELGTAQGRRFYTPAMIAKPIECVFQIHLDRVTGARRLVTRRFTEVASSINEVLFFFEP